MQPIEALVSFDLQLMDFKAGGNVVLACMDSHIS
jgi:hypothetical protein